MKTIRQTVVTRRDERLGTVIFSVRGDSFGSLDLAKLAQLRADLAAGGALLATGRDRVVVDLSAVTMFGTGFLRELFLWIPTLNCPPEDVIVCGDRLGLLKVSATDRWMIVRADLAAALELIQAQIKIGLVSQRHKCLVSC